MKFAHQISFPVAASDTSSAVASFDAGAPIPGTIPRRELASAAAAEDRGEVSIAGSISHLHKAGLLAWDPPSPVMLCADLMAVAESSLPVARLYEGHLNAIRLVQTLGGKDLQDELRRDVNDGVLLGVWGAEGAIPLFVDGDLLAGGKRFCSGLGTVGKAVVTVGQGDAVRLAVLEVSDPCRHQPEAWRKTGMRATVSGDFDATGMLASSLCCFGAPGRYLEEPGFIGGVWRIAAVQVGATLGLLRAAADHLQGLGRLMAEPQVARLAPVLTRALAAADFVRRAAICAEGPAGQQEPERAVSMSAQARLLTEDVGQDAIAAVERSVGLPHFDEDAITGRIARDLGTYMRQAARDALLQRAGGWALGRPGSYLQFLAEG